MNESMVIIMDTAESMSSGNSIDKSEIVSGKMVKYKILQLPRKKDEALILGIS